jgi:hypothetical protein
VRRGHDGVGVTVSGFVDGVARVALVGLAKNTGKTQTLTTVLAEHAAAGHTVGVTSIGRDGETRDAIDGRIAKPQIELQAGSLVATTDLLLRASGLPYELLDRTGIRTPLGEVLLVRLAETGTLEVAGPSAGVDLRKIGSAMLALGAGQVLIDGSIDRRAASAPGVSEALVMATGAVLGDDLDSVVKATVEAVELTGLPAVGPLPEPPVNVPARLVLNADPPAIAGLLHDHPLAEVFAVEGALGERFLDGLLAARRERAGREFKILASDPTSVFLAAHGPAWYRRQGIAIEVRRTIRLAAITVNPVAPLRHRFESADLRASIEAAIPGVPVLDVLDESYLAATGA